MYGFLSSLLQQKTPTPLESLMKGYTDTASSLNQLQKQRLANALQKQQLQEEPQRFQTQQALRQAQTGRMQAQTSQMPARLALQQRQADLRSRGLDIQSKRQMPVRTLAQYISHLPPNQREVFLNQHPNVVSQIGDSLVQDVMQAKGLPVNAPSQMQQTQQGIQESPEQVLQASGQSYVAPVIPTKASAQGISDFGTGGANAQEPRIPQGTTASELHQQLDLNGGLSPNDQVRFTAQMAANFNDPSVTTQMKDRYYNALALEQFFQNPRMNEVVKNAAKYAGIQGKGKAAVDALNKNNPEAYEDYLEFKNIMSNNFTNMIRKMEGLGVRSDQRKELKGMITDGFNSLTSNPKRAMDQYARLRKELRNIAKNDSAQVQKSFPGLIEKRLGISYDDEIPGLLSDERKQGSAQEKLNPPQFQNKQQEIEWFKSLTPEKQKQYMKMMGY